MLPFMTCCCFRDADVLKNFQAESKTMQRRKYMERMERGKGESESE